MTTWTLRPDWIKLPLSMNYRLHWAVHAQRTARIREWACHQCTYQLIPPLEHAVVEFIWYAPDLRRRDEENAVDTAKAVYDGIVDAGVVPDDVPGWMTKLMPEIRYRKGEPGFEVIIIGNEAET